jgi:hypothetical protein
MSYKNHMAFATLVFAVLIGGPADAGSLFDCYSHAVPKQNSVCQTAIVTPEGSEPFTCGETRNHDQAVYCGAVYGYEQGWCARIQDPALRRKCFRDTE